MADQEAGPVVVCEKERQVTVAGNVGSVVLLLHGLLTVTIRNGEYAGMKSQANEDIMVVNDDFISLVVDVLLSGLALVCACGATDAAKRDVSQGLGLVEVG
jgi:hypothetical protein